ncbi:MAG TPA: hypothetical protein VGY50_09270, partial [Streptosporangiaceae bacterium]|nr:hypothetical protein [Streptosporangiaceae bacterium]
MAGSGYGGRAGISPATATVPAAARRRAGPAGALRDVVSPATWLAVVHLLCGLIIGTVSCIVVLICIGTGLGTAP